MPYSVEFRPGHEHDLDRLSNPVAQRLLKKIKWLAEHFDQVQHEPLTGNLKGLYKLRVGDYRVMYSFSKELQLITIHYAGHRRNIYEER